MLELVISCNNSVVIPQLVISVKGNHTSIHHHLSNTKAVYKNKLSDIKGYLLICCKDFSVVNECINENYTVTHHMAKDSNRRELFAYQQNDFGSDFQERKPQNSHI